eukprot:4265769-Alexandrium_andersonii.AAC.1
MVQRATRAWDRFYDILYTSPMFLDAKALNDLRKVTLRFGAAVQSLRSIARDKHVLAWNMTYKVHARQHLPDQAAIVNPRYCQCYQEESQ